MGGSQVVKNTAAGVASNSAVLVRPICKVTTFQASPEGQARGIKAMAAPGFAEMRSQHLAGD